MFNLAHAQNYGLAVATVSTHYGGNGISCRDGGRLNERNWGVSAQYYLDNQTTIEAGFYKNSIHRTSVFVAAG
ncbi:MAG: hypothetical protein N2235_10585 [Fischerella sp.]|nr:hypothetical protein [Fischerella sp.]